MKDEQIHPYTLKFAQWLLDEHGEYVLWKLVLCGILFVPLFIAMIAFAVLGSGDDEPSKSDENDVDVHKPKASGPDSPESFIEGTPEWYEWGQFYNND